MSKNRLIKTSKILLGRQKTLDYLKCQKFRSIQWSTGPFRRLQLRVCKFSTHWEPTNLRRDQCSHLEKAETKMRINVIEIIRSQAPTTMSTSNLKLKSVARSSFGNRQTVNTKEQK